MTVKTCDSRRLHVVSAALARTGVRTPSLAPDVQTHLTRLTLPQGLFPIALSCTRLHILGYSSAIFPAIFRKDDTNGPS